MKSIAMNLSYYMLFAVATHMCVSVSVFNKIYKTHCFLFLELRIVLFSINSFTISMKFDGKYPVSHTDICDCIE